MADPFRVERYRQAAWRDDLDRAGAPPPLAGRRFVGQIYNAGAIPTSVPKWFATHPVGIDGPEVEGGASSNHVDTASTVFVLVLGPAVPVAGDSVIAREVGGRWATEFGGAMTSMCPWINALVRDCGGVPRPGATVHATKSGGFDRTCTTGSDGRCKIPITVDGTYHVVATYGVDSQSFDLDTTHSCIVGFCLGGVAKVRGVVVGCCGISIGAGVPVKFQQLGATVATVVTDSLGRVESCVPTSDPVTLLVDAPPPRYLGASTGPVSVLPACSTHGVFTVQLPTASGFCCFPCCGSLDPGQLTPCASSTTAPDPCGSISVTDPFFGNTATLLPVCGLDGSGDSWRGSGSAAFPACAIPYGHGPCPPLTVDLLYRISGVTLFSGGSACALSVSVTWPAYDHTAFPGCIAPYSTDGSGTPVPTTRSNSGFIHVTACPPGFSGSAAMAHPGDLCSVTTGLPLTFPLTEI